MSILGLFPLLSSHDQPTRISASTTLIQSIPTQLSQTDTQYALTRLLNGLSSSNQNSRQGFAVALTSLIQKVANGEKEADEDGGAAKKVWEELIKSTTAATSKFGAESGKEERDLLFARLFGLHSLLLSGVLYHPSTPTETGKELFKEVVLALHSLSLKKSWMKEPAYWVLIEGVKSLERADKEPEWKDEIESWLVQRLIGDSREKARGYGAEKVALILVLKKFAVEADWQSLLSPTFPSGNPLSRSSLVALSSAIKGTPTDSAPSAPTPRGSSNATKTSTSVSNSSINPGANPHFVWDVIFDVYFGGEKDTGEKAKWEDLWRVCVDQSLFAPPSLSLKSTGFSLLQTALSKLPPSSIPSLFGEGIIRTLSNSLKKSGKGDEKILHRAGEKLIATLVAFVERQPQEGIKVILALTFPPHGSPLFPSNILDKLLSSLPAQSFSLWITKLQSLILVPSTAAELLAANEGEEEAKEVRREVNAKRMWALDRLLDCARKGWKGAEGDETRRGVLEFVAVGGWFDITKEGKGARSYVPNPPYTPSIRSEFRSRFFSILTAFLASQSTTSWLSRSLSLLQNLASDKKHFELVKFEEDDEEDDVEESRKEVLGMVDKLGKGEREECAKELARGVVLASWEGDDGAEVLEQIKDLLPALFPAVFPQDTSDDEEDEEEEGEIPEPTTILIDVLLELLHRPSAFVKSIAQNAFSGFSKEVGEQGFELLLEQIRPEEPEVVEEEDVEMADAKPNGTAKPVEASESDSESEEGEDEDDSDDEVDVDDAFREELLAALQASGVADEFDAMESDGEDETEEEELLDDDQMMALDDKLADIFRMQGGGKKGRKAERTEGLHYRLRVVDLLESLSKQRTLSPLLVLTIIPLFSIIRSATEVEKELHSKSTKLLRQIVSSKRDVPTLEDPQSAIEALVELHKIALSVEESELANLCSQSSIFLVKSALASPASTAATSKKVAAIFQMSFEEYMKKKNVKTKLQPTLTVEFCRRAPACAWEMRSELVELASASTTNAFRRMQAFEVVGALVTSYNATKTDASKAALLDFMPSYRSALFSAISSSLASTTNTFDASRLKELLKLSLSSIRITTSLSSPSQSAKIWKGDEWAALGEQFRESERFKGATGVLGLFKQLVGVIGGGEKSNGGAGGKRKADEISKSGDAKKGKKEKKEVKVPVVESDGEVEVEDDEEPEVDEETVHKGKKEKKDKKKDKKQKKRKTE